MGFRVQVPAEALRGWVAWRPGALALGLPSRVGCLGSGWLPGLQAALPMGVAAPGFPSGVARSMLRKWEAKDGLLTARCFCLISVRLFVPLGSGGAWIFFNLARLLAARRRRFSDGSPVRLCPMRSSSGGSSRCSGGTWLTCLAIGRCEKSRGCSAAYCYRWSPVYDGSAQ